MVAAGEWRFESRLPWPSVRGQRLWRHITGDTSAAPDAFAFPPSPPAARYDVELCETTAGHVALVLLRRQATPAAGAAAQLAIPRVLIVVDAVAPKPTAAKRPSATTAGMSLKTEQPQWALLSTRAHSFGGALAADDSATAFLSTAQEPADVDELALVEELFSSSKATKDACLLAKPPLLCARFDCRLVAVRFTRGSASPLRAVVAREDGMCYIWEWGADLQQWSFLNRFCFLENSSLKWTRPVRLFTTTDAGGDSTQLAWWTANAADAADARLFTRALQFGVEKSTFRTEIRIGGAFAVASSPPNVLALRGSARGLWVVARDGVGLRAPATALHLPWAAVVDRSAAGGDGVLSCVHSGTGELVLLHRASRKLVLVTDSAALLRRRVVATLDDDSVESIAAHRQLVLVLSKTGLSVWSLVSGEPLAASLALPTASQPLVLWTATATRPGASAVGVFGPQGYWRLEPPRAASIVAAHAAPQHRLRAAAAYGATLEFDAAREALDLLQSARQLEDEDRRAAWDAAVASVSSPALVLATLAASSAASSPSLVRSLGDAVSAVHHVTHEVLATGRFSAALEKRDDPLLLKGLPLATHANVEALHHLANWVLLATRRLARLEGAKHLRERAVSAVSTLSAGEDDVPALGPLEEEEEEEEEERLSRKLRPMSSLQFAAGSTSVRHGRQWLTQLESLLLSPAAASPHALLLHEERSLADFQAALSSFSKHMFFESMARLLLLHAPARLLPFVRRVAQFAPQRFTLEAHDAVATRPHAERALLLLPPVELLVGRVKKEGSQDDQCAAPGASLLAYVELLAAAGHELEACRVLLTAELYDASVDRLEALKREDVEPPVVAAVFFAVLEYCIAHRGAGDLEALLRRKPRHVDPLVVLRVLTKLLPRQVVAPGERAVSVGALRHVLLSLLKEHREATSPLRSG